MTKIITANKAQSPARTSTIRTKYANKAKAAKERTDLKAVLEILWH